MSDQPHDTEIQFLRQRISELEEALAQKNNLQQELRECQLQNSQLTATIQQIQDQSTLYKTIIDTSLDLIFVKDTNFRYILVNETLAKSLGKTTAEIIGKDDLELNTPPELVFGNPEKNIRGFRTDDQLVIAGETIHNSFDPAPNKDGELLILDTKKIPLRNSKGEIFGLLGIARDITDRYRAEEELRKSEADLRQRTLELEQTIQQLKQAQSQLIHSEKMSSLGQIVAGIAHEINNPINFIYGNLIHADKYSQDILNLLSLYQKHYPDPHPEIHRENKLVDIEFLQKDLPLIFNSMQFGVERISKIIDSLKSFSRLDQSQVKFVDIHAGINSTLTILEYRLNNYQNSPPINIIKNYGQLPLVECYPGDLNQVFMNILVNAIDALEGIGVKNNNNNNNNNNVLEIQHPEIRITTEISSEISPDQYITIRIADNGLGMTPEVQQKIFDPFYTTKPVGKGTGLGLSVSYQIIAEQHRGFLNCISAVGQGSEFIITIPVYQQVNRY